MDTKDTAQQDTGEWVRLTPGLVLAQCSEDGTCTHAVVEQDTSNPTGLLLLVYATHESWTAHVSAVEALALARRESEQNGTAKVPRPRVPAKRKRPRAPVPPTR